LRASRPEGAGRGRTAANPSKEDRVIEVEGLTKYYGDFRAIEDVTFTVSKGEILGFLGPNGAGKTTTMRILTGYMPASQGRCRIGGTDVFEDPITVKRRIGYLPENVPLYPELTVEEYLRFVAQIKGVAAADIPAALERITGKCGLQDVRNRLIRQLSKGFRQRVGLAQALIHEPDVIVLDEPTIGLDPAQIREVRELIRGLGRDHTIILSSHILPEVSQVCDRVLIINKGRILTEDTPDNLTRAARGKAPLDLLLGGDEAAVRSVLDRAAEAADYTLQPADEGGLWRARLPLEDESRRPELARMIQAAGLDLYEMYLRRATLEDVFLELTTEEKGAADAPDVPDDTDEPSPEVSE
jgi:ABC-2 type transport system ATP-binding protein